MAFATASDIMPRLIIAAAQNGSGKTTVTAGRLAALAARGVQVTPFKVGLDYIDPTYHYKEIESYATFDQNLYKNR